jgi:hypothetical protein
MFTGHSTTAGIRRSEWSAAMTIDDKRLAPVGDQGGIDAAVWTRDLLRSEGCSETAVRQKIDEGNWTANRPSPQRVTDDQPPKRRLIQ